MIRKDEHLRKLIYEAIKEVLITEPQNICRYFQAVGVPSYELLERTMKASAELEVSGFKINPKNIAIQMIEDYGIEKLIDDYIAMAY